MLHRLLFDVTAPDESANVGAFVRAGDDGTLIGHVSDALKVNISNASIAVTATNLDIRDLVFATDKVDVSGSSVSITGDVNVTQGTSPWVVSATNLDIRDLTAASDSVQAWAFDGAGTALTSTLVSGKQALDVNVANAITTSDAALANVALANEADSITTTSGAAIASPLANRKYVMLYNNGSKIVYLGAGTVTAANGFPLPPGSFLEARLGAAVAINAIAQSGTQDIRVLQMS